MQCKWIVFIPVFLMNLIAVPNIKADEETIKLKPIPVKSARSTMTGENITSSITIITEEEIKEKQFITVSDLLTEQLGLDVVRTGPMGGLTNVFTRGSGSSSTLVLIDGVQVNSSSSGAFDFANLTVDNIERIEILRGPQSTLWGADAVGGVINVITKKGRGTPSHSISFEGGSFGTFKESIQSSGALGKFDYSIAASRIDSDGFSSANEDRGNSEDDGYENTTVSTKLGYNFQGNGRAEIIARYTRSLFQFDTFSFASNLPTDGGNRSATNAYYLAAPIQKTFAGWWDVSINPNLAYEYTSSFDPTFSNAHILSRTYTLDLQNNLDLGKYHSLIFGADLQIQNGVNQESSLNQSIYSQGYFMQGVFNYQDRFLFTGGFRHDLNSAFQNKTTYKFESSYRIRETGTRIRGAYATGFRAPSINDLFFPGFSNPDLKPEETDSWEAGLDQNLFGDRVRVGVVYFESNFTNLIQFDSVSSSVLNIGQADSKGVETEIDLKLTDNVNLAVRHTWNPTFDANDAPLARRAKHKFAATLRHNWRNKLHTLVSVRVRDGIRDGSGDTGAFSTVRAVMSYQLTKNLKITARGENLFDKSYEEIPGYGTAGVSGYSGFTYFLN